ncbi:MAG: VirB3 family type IV secretion system protein, partial [Fretibacterium sp.]|nr:VirB3 family type IV secretion system protein [Fretibacterium sp.]
EEHLRIATVRRSLTRPQFIFGCDRTLFLLLLLACMALGLPGGLASGNFVNFFIALIIFFAGLQVLRAMGKKDPLTMRIFQRAVKYQERYLASSRFYRQDRKY